jgi:nucleosome binding factor SPN SPT16 subunit
MKLNDTQIYKGIGTIQMAKNEDGERCYLYTHFFNGKTYDEDTIKGAKEMLDYEERQAQEIRSAISILSRHNYKVFKEIA